MLHEKKNSALFLLVALAIAPQTIDSLFSPLNLRQLNSSSNSQRSHVSSNETTATATTTTTAAAATTTTTSANNSTSISSNYVISQAPANDLSSAAAQAANVKPEEIPRSDRREILLQFERFFSKPRSHEDQPYKEYVREGVVKRLRELGFETSFLQKSRFEFRRRPAVSYNMISILPGKHRQTKQDQIVLVGAHWDSFNLAPGVDDNGSGSTCLLEIARLLSVNRCNFNHTIMLVWFDYEEHGKYGSEFFVNDYLYPFELDKYQSKFIGAFILDMILVREKDNDTQSLPLNLKIRLPEFSEELEREKNRGDFLATWSRRHHDQPLEDIFRYAWTSLGFESRTFKSMRPELPQSRLPNSEERYEWKDFFRSDHASFWFPTLISNTVRRAPSRQHDTTASHASLNAILLTDLGPWRKSYQRCYHSACDDQHFLTDGNIAFMQQVTDSLVLALMRLGQGQCQPSNRQSNLTNKSSSLATSATITTTTATTPTIATLATIATPATQSEPVTPAFVGSSLPVTSTNQQAITSDDSINKNETLSKT